MSDVWKAVAGFPGYFVSDLGKVMSVRQGEPRRLKPKPNGAGRFRVNLMRDGAAVWFQIHRLVCEAFNGAAPSGAPEVDHINRDSGDNRAENLRWVTRIANQNNTLGRGAYWAPSKGRWKSQIMVCGRSIHLGYFDTAEAARAAYVAAKAEHHGVTS